MSNAWYFDEDSAQIQLESKIVLEEISFFHFIVSFLKRYLQVDFIFYNNSIHKVT